MDKILSLLLLFLLLNFGEGAAESENVDGSGSDLSDEFFIPESKSDKALYKLKEVKCFQKNF